MDTGLIAGDFSNFCYFVNISKFSNINVYYRRSIS